MDEYRQRVSEGVEQPAQHNLRLINEVEPPELQEVEVPKVLGDVFEALIGGYFYSRGQCSGSAYLCLNTEPDACLFSLILLHKI